MNVTWREATLDVVELSLPPGLHSAWHSFWLLGKELTFTWSSLVYKSKKYLLVFCFSDSHHPIQQEIAPGGDDSSFVAVCDPPNRGLWHHLNLQLGSGWQWGELWVFGVVCEVWNRGWCVAGTKCLGKSFRGYVRTTTTVNNWCTVSWCTAIRV